MILSTQTFIPCREHGAIEGVLMLCRAGYDALDLSLTQREMAEIEALGNRWHTLADAQREAAESHGVTFVQAHAPFGGDRETYFAESVSRFPLAFAYAARLGVRNIVVHPLHATTYTGHEEELFCENMRFYKELLPLAREYDTVIAVENMWLTHRGSNSCADDACADPREHLRYVDALKETDPDRFTACLDLGHVAVCRREPQDAIRILGDRIGCLHVHDVDYHRDLHTMPFMGSLDWDAICAALKEVGYRGAFNYEADNFLANLPPETHETACRLMAQVGRSLIARIEG